MEESLANHAALGGIEDPDRTESLGYYHLATEPQRSYVYWINNSRWQYATEAKRTRKVLPRGIRQHCVDLFAKRSPLTGVSA